MVRVLTLLEFLRAPVTELSFVILQLRIRLATRSTRAFTTSSRAFHSTNHDYEISIRPSRSPWRFSVPSELAPHLITYVVPV